MRVAAQVRPLRQAVSEQLVRLQTHVQDAYVCERFEFRGLREQDFLCNLGSLR